MRWNRSRQNDTSSQKSDNTSRENDRQTASAELPSALQDLDLSTSQVQAIKQVIRENNQKLEQTLASFKMLMRRPSNWKPLGLPPSEILSLKRTSRRLTKSAVGQRTGQVSLRRALRTTTQTMLVLLTKATVTVPPPAPR